MAVPGIRNIPQSPILALFFLSGALALTYQVVWVRLMTHAFGSTALAVGTVLAAFMSGLALGGWYAGRLADRSANPLRLYALLELGIAAAALFSHECLHRLDTVFPALHAMLEPAPVAIAVLRFVMAFLLVLAPTLLMGATLPVLARLLVQNPRRAGHRLSSLYAANTLGAVAGVALTGFWLIGRYGVHVPVYLAVAGNLLVGALAWWVAARLPSVRASASEAATAPDAAGDSTWAVDRPTLRLVILGLGLSGFTSFAYEIYWTRSLVFVLGNSTYALSTMLIAFLTGIAVGGFGIRFLFTRVRDGVLLFGAIQLALGLVSSVALPLLFSSLEPQGVGQLLLDPGSRPLSLLLAALGTASLLMLVPAILIGATFPLVGQLAVQDAGRTGRSVGNVYAVNTLGNVLGALLPGLVLLAWLGVQRGILAMAVINCSLGVLLLALRLWPRGRAWRAVPPLAAVASVALLASVPLGFEFPSEGERPGHRTLYYREGPLATTKVFSDPRSDEKLMSVDGIVIGGTGMTEFKQLLLAHLPKLLLDDVGDELSIGLGSGILAGESLLHDRVRNLTVVEIEPGVIEGAKEFERENHGVLQHPRLQVIEDDIANFLRTTKGEYDVISADEKTADEYASNGFSYSLDYYELLLDHLAPNGLVAQWVPTTLPPRQYEMILKTFSEVFPAVQLWYFLPAWQRGPFNSILVGSKSPIPIEPRRIARRFRIDSDAYASLRRYGLTSVDALLPHYVTDGQSLRSAVAAAPVNSLDHPRYEFYTPWDYALERGTKIADNHRMLAALQRESQADFFETQVNAGADPLRLRQGLAAEARYLFAFERFLHGMPLDETYKRFDGALAMAPWNDSLRARIYAQYRYLALTRSDPAERRKLMERANSLYAGDAEARD